MIRYRVNMVGMTNFGHNGRLGNQIFQFMFMTNYHVFRDLPISVPTDNSFFELFDIKIPIRACDSYSHKCHENGLTYDENNLLQSSGTDFHGFFQSERYIPWTRNQCRTEFKIKDRYIDEAKEWLKSHNADVVNSVGVHIRRGDYTNTDDFYFNPPINYYVDGAHKTKMERAILFSDGVITEEEKTLFSDLNPVICSENALLSFTILSMCESLVISASTYGWWASYLSESKTSYCPQKWYGNKGPADKNHMWATHLTRWNPDA